MTHLIAHWLGFGNREGNGSLYLFWSGFFPDVPILLGAAVLVHHHQCAQDGCRRIGVAHRDHYCRKHSR